MTWRQAQMVLLSAQGMDTARIAEVTFTSPDRVRDVIRLGRSPAPRRETALTLPGGWGRLATEAAYRACPDASAAVSRPRNLPRRLASPAAASRNDRSTPLRAQVDAAGGGPAVDEKVDDRIPDGPGNISIVSAASSVQ
ncbi:hypothetical protein [Actinomadura rugatobispora]|uniref:Uncharacterized protein n=1 Tax=Actinomadura rugatobispora TaxID=1994 RepID=A0ABW1A061_9ACTN|nr:hypothetical protein GCM10010200_011610 [Actinomadura rugatobispora]